MNLNAASQQMCNNTSLFSIESKEVKEILFRVMSHDCHYEKTAELAEKLYNNPNEASSYITDELVRLINHPQVYFSVYDLEQYKEEHMIEDVKKIEGGIPISSLLFLLCHMFFSDYSKADVISNITNQISNLLYVIEQLYYQFYEEVNSSKGMVLSKANGDINDVNIMFEYIYGFIRELLKPQIPKTQTEEEIIEKLQRIEERKTGLICQFEEFNKQEEELYKQLFTVHNAKISDPNEKKIRITMG